MTAREDILACADCGGNTLRRGPTQRYCSTCSAIRDTKRKQEWRERHGNPSGARRSYTDIKSAMVESGSDRSLAARASVAWDADADVEWHTHARVVVPFDYAASKNAVWRTGRGGHIYARAESTAVRDNLAARIREAGHTWHQGKIWIDIFVEKPNHRGDAINVIDLVCDAIKDAIGVDDRWYSIARLDWAIVKVEPKLIVGIRQSVTEDHQVCSHCGRDLALASEFGRNRSTKTGFGRVCKDCSAPKRGRRTEPEEKAA